MRGESEIELGDSSGSTQRLPGRKIIMEAHQNMCTNVTFWEKIKSGKFPYVFDQDKNKLAEAAYDLVITSLKPDPTSPPQDIYWLTDTEVPEVSKTLQNIHKINVMKHSYREQIEKYK